MIGHRPSRGAGWPEGTPQPAAPHAWDVLLIGGASGVGKRSLAYPLARQLGRQPGRPVLDARPWDTMLERAITALS